MKRLHLVFLIAAFPSCGSGPACEYASSNGTCYYTRPQTWPESEIESKELAWLILARSLGFEYAPKVLAQVHVEAADDYFYCGGNMPLAGCSLGLGWVKVVSLPLCSAPLAHEFTHILLAIENRDTDYNHRHSIWGSVDETEHNCPKLEGEWLTKTCAALARWGHSPRECQ